MAAPTHSLSPIESALDRFQEAHFWIHMLEQYYHVADPFRWHLNAFLKSIKEVPDLLQMGLQNRDGFADWFRIERAKLSEDPLMRALSKQRDLVVHRGMLVPNSHGSLGITEGRGFKLGFTFPVHPLEDSEHAMTRYLHYVAREKDFLGILLPDDDSLPCVHREWKIPPFEEEVVELAARAWLRTGETVNATVAWMGETPPLLSLDCLHSGQKVQFKLFDRKQLKAEFREIKKNTPAGLKKSEP